MAACGPSEAGWLVSPNCVLVLPAHVCVVRVLSQTSVAAVARSVRMLINPLTGGVAL